MQILGKFNIFLVVTVFFNKILCFCEESYIVICDDLADIKQNDTVSWRYVLIGSDQFRSEPPSQILDSGITFFLSRTKSLTIINRIRQIRTPLIVTAKPPLAYFNLYGNHISEIEDYTFQNLPNLREVYLENNKIQHLGRGIFKNTTLDVVNLSRNRIESITTGFHESKIKWILLNNNKIDFIKARSFPNEVEQLELNHNLLEALDETVFENLINLKELYLQHNLLTTIPNISHLKQIQYLHFTNNKITQVHYRFDEHKNLEYVDLGSNLIRNVSVDAFASTKSPPLVLLNFNRLTNIKFVTPEKRTDMALYGNPWNCDCLFHIEKIRSDHKHMESCDFGLLHNGTLPVCIENGKCGEKEITQSDMERFQDVVKSSEKNLFCFFRL